MSPRRQYTHSSNSNCNTLLDLQDSGSVHSNSSRGSPVVFERTPVEEAESPSSTITTSSPTATTATPSGIFGGYSMSLSSLGLSLPFGSATSTSSSAATSSTKGAFVPKSKKDKGSKSY